MKEITEEDIKKIESELAAARKEYESMSFNNLDERLNWISKFFNGYVPELEKRFLTEEELNDWVFLPNELRIKFYEYFPEHGLNMANYSQELMKEKSRSRRFQYVSRLDFSHYD